MMFYILQPKSVFLEWQNIDLYFESKMCISTSGVLYFHSEGLAALHNSSTLAMELYL